MPSCPPVGCFPPSPGRCRPRAGGGRSAGSWSAVLGLLLAPPVAPPLSAALAAVAFAALVGSFAVDVAWLLRRGR